MLATQMDQRFDQVDQRFDQVDQRFDRLEGRVDRIEATMVTKDYLDDKLADLRGDMVVLVRKEDKKLDTLVEILTHKNIISEHEARTISSMEPFSRKL